MWIALSLVFVTVLLSARTSFALDYQACLNASRLLSNSEVTPGAEGILSVEFRASRNRNNRLLDTYRAGSDYELTIIVNETRAVRRVVLAAVLYSQQRNHYPRPLGVFQTPAQGWTLVRECPDLIKNISPDLRKTTIGWKAPSPTQGCVEFRAVVTDSNGTIYTGAPSMNYRVCDTEGVGENGESMAQLSECCACGTAKYEMIFEGLWSQQSHPRGFPTDTHAALVHWSNIMGASHSSRYAPYTYGATASRGIKRICEYGDTAVLESELRQNSGSVRTIIKLDGIWVNLKQLRHSRFSVNASHHLLSVLSMLGPSPDWCAGVSAFDMCAKNCTWLGDQVIDLHLWDAGTDDGATYLSADAQREFPKPIRKMSESRESLPPSNPFKSPTKPVARLHIKKLSANAAGCRATSTRDMFGQFVDPAKLKPVDALPPSSSGGGKPGMIKPGMIKPGMAGKMMKPGVAPGQLLMMTGKKQMMKKQVLAFPDQPNIKPECMTSFWTDWSSCSASCGIGVRLRERDFIEPSAQPMLCQIPLRQKRSCRAEPCPTTKPVINFERSLDTFNTDTTCAVSEWSAWSPCSTTCDAGSMVRYREFKQSKAAKICTVPREMRRACNVKGCNVDYKTECKLPLDRGPCRSEFWRWFYDTRTQKCRIFLFGGCQGNNNNFATKENCERLCIDALREDDQRMAIVMADQAQREMASEVVDCMVTQWSQWSTCDVSCGRGRSHRTRMVKKQPTTGGRRCPDRLNEVKRCRKPTCPASERDCALAAWSQWYACDRSCGIASRLRTRKVLQQPIENGKRCELTVERDFCQLPICPNRPSMFTST